MLFVPPLAAVDPPLSRVSGAQKDSVSWRIRISARCGSVADTRNVAGVAPAAREGADPMDRSEPPPSPGKSMSLYFPDDAGASPRTVDIRPQIPEDAEPAARGWRWSFDVARPAAEVSAEEVALEFEGIDGLPRSLGALLIDRALGQTVELGSRRRYDVVLGRRDVVARSSEARFELRVGTPEYVADSRATIASIPDRTGFQMIAPNPIVTTALVRFATARAGRITVTVFDFAGRRVRTLTDGNREPGRYEAVWRGDDGTGRAAPPGLYFVRLAAPDRDDVRKLIRVR